MTPFTIQSTLAGNRLTIDLEHLVGIGGPIARYQHGWFVAVKLFFMFRDEPISIVRPVAHEEQRHESNPEILCTDDKWRDEIELERGLAMPKAVERVMSEIVAPLEAAWQETQN